MSDHGVRFDEGFPVALARESGDAEEHAVDENPDQDVVWDAVDRAPGSHSSYEYAEPDIERGLTNEGPAWDPAGGEPSGGVS